MKTTSIFLIICLFMLAMNLSAESTVDTVWTKCYGGGGFEFGRSVQLTNDDGFIIAGDTESYGEAGSFDMWMLKLDSDGDTLWTGIYGDFYEERGYFAHQTSDNGYIIGGTTGSYGNGFYDFWLVKTDGSGDTLWTKPYGGLNYDWGNFGQQTNDGGYILTGYTDSYGSGVSSLMLIKTDDAGNVSWAKTIGGPSSEYGCTLEQTTDSGYIISGDTYSYGAGSRDIYLVKTDINGDTLWTRAFGGTGSDGAGYKSIMQTNDGGYILTGYTKSFGAGNSDVWLIRIDSNGDTLWAKTFGGGEDDGGESVIETNDGGFIITGYTESFGDISSDLWIIRTDANGNELYNKTYGINGIPEHGRQIKKISDSTYIIVGDNYLSDVTEYNIWILKIIETIETSIENICFSGMQIDKSIHLKWTGSNDANYIIYKGDNQRFNELVNTHQLEYTDIYPDIGINNYKLVCVNNNEKQWERKISITYSINDVLKHIPRSIFGVKEINNLLKSDYVNIFSVIGKKLNNIESCGKYLLIIKDDNGKISARKHIIVIMK